MSHEQSSTFLSDEGDNWFLRNMDTSHDALSQDICQIFQTLSNVKDDISSVLDVGCSSGMKTKQLANYFTASGFGLDPSSLAIDKAKTLEDVTLNFKVGISSDLQYENDQFDLVYFSFCLYLIDRELIFKSIAEADRVLRPGGYLVISDFDSSLPSKTPYHHKSGLLTYRNDYAGIFLSSGHYTLVSKQSFSHTSNLFETNKRERVSTQILFKETDAYPEF